MSEQREKGSAIFAADLSLSLSLSLIYDALIIAL